MKKIAFAVWIISFFTATVVAFAAEKPKASEVTHPLVTELSDPAYIIGPGDQLEISIWKEEALTKLVTVLPDGKICFPLIGEVTASGRTIQRLKEEVKAKLMPFVPEPILSIDVKQAASMMIYVIGKVNAPGRFPLNANINVLQALSTAGGLNPFAKRNHIKIFREDKDGETRVFEFHYDEAVDDAKLGRNMHLRRGDVVVVP